MSYPGVLEAECPFLDAEAGDYRLAPASACWDVLPETDCEGTRGDIGAFEGKSGCW
jgi:hypothetical protein